jgi:putative spermidine/putrescine transport system permease protein
MDFRTMMRPALIILPAIALVAGAFVYPILKFIGFGLIGSRADHSTFAGLLVGIATNFWGVTLTTLELGCWTTLVTLIVGYPIAYYLVRSPSRYRYLVFLAILVPMMFSVVIRTFGWIILLGSNGLLNDVLLRFGIINEPKVWLYNLPATVVALLHIFLPFMVLSIMSALYRIDRSIEDAAMILGAGRRAIFWHITLPLSGQGIFGGCAIVFSLSMGAYVTPNLIGGGRIRVLATEIYSQMLEVGDWRLAGLLGLVLAALTLGIVITYRLAMKQTPATA